MPARAQKWPGARLVSHIHRDQRRFDRNTRKGTCGHPRGEAVDLGAHCRHPGRERAEGAPQLCFIYYRVEQGFIQSRGGWIVECFDRRPLDPSCCCGARIDVISPVLRQRRLDPNRPNRANRPAGACQGKFELASKVPSMRNSPFFGEEARRRGGGPGQAARDDRLCTSLRMRNGAGIDSNLAPSFRDFGLVATHEEVNPSTDGRRVAHQPAPSEAVTRAWPLEPRDRSQGRRRRKGSDRRCRRACRQKLRCRPESHRRCSRLP